MEQVEDEVVDHNIIAVPVGEVAALGHAVRLTLIDFVEHVFANTPNTRVRAGNFLSENAAREYIAQHSRREDIG
jgi:exonuclease VII large subunit